MSQRFGRRSILKKPVTKEELIRVISALEREMDQKVWAAIPWYKRLWLRFRAKRRKARAVKVRVAGVEAGNPEAARRERAAEVGERAATNGTKPT